MALVPAADSETPAVSNPLDGQPLQPGVVLPGGGEAPAALITSANGTVANGNLRSVYFRDGQWVDGDNQPIPEPRGYLKRGAAGLGETAQDPVGAEADDGRTLAPGPHLGGLAMASAGGRAESEVEDETTRAARLKAETANHRDFLARMDAKVAAGNEEFGVPGEANAEPDPSEPDQVEDAPGPAEPAVAEAPVAERSTDAEPASQVAPIEPAEPTPVPLAPSGMPVVDRTNGTVYEGRKLDDKDAALGGLLAGAELDVDPSNPGALRRRLSGMWGAARSVRVLQRTVATGGASPTRPNRIASGFAGQVDRWTRFADNLMDRALRLPAQRARGYVRSQASGMANDFAEANETLGGYVDKYAPRLDRAANQVIAGFIGGWATLRNQEPPTGQAR